MRILGLDTSGKVAAAALYDSESCCILAQQVLYTRRTHSQVILPLAERILADTGLTWQEVEGIAAAIGPGSYTGLRIGVAAVQALAYGLGIPCAGVSTLEGLAWQNLSWRGVICPVMLARQTLVYTGLYQSDGKGITPVWEDQLMESAELSQRLSALSQPVLLVGDATALLSDGAFLSASPATRLQNGVGLCLAAADGDRWQPPKQLQPAYLQLVKAEKELQQRRNG